ncbi:transient receptor potential cation channel subfamily V member 3-like [Petaurus breviceps papuanus]|uniref:transient receptor potential cation channel subfamily V member 3-like n=1 Tax=Petaurus breviceps papuanus TaxID=3040969 RepID=UPI0036DC2728
MELGENGHLPGWELGNAGFPCRQGQDEAQEETLLDGKGDDLDLQRTDSSIALGDLEAVKEQLREIHRRGLELTDPLLRERTTGKTCLMKALLRSQDKSEQQVLAMVRVLLQYAEEHGELPALLNACYTDKIYYGQTALHIAIERGLQSTVQLLVEKGAHLRARATGLFFQLNPTKEQCFYFGEHPLSLAACTHQPDVVKFLLSQADPCLAEARDSLKNTVLHALVLGASDHPGVADMYELVLELSEARRLRDSTASRTHLEKLRNQQGLTPLQLAAKEGQVELFQRILSRELPVGDPLHHLSRRFLEWTYGPVSCSLYDLSEVDTTETHSALKMVVSNPDMEKAYELLKVEPLHSLLQSKWASFAGPMFAISTAWYLVYMGLFTAITAQQPATLGSQDASSPLCHPPGVHWACPENTLENRWASVHLPVGRRDASEDAPGPHPSGRPESVAFSRLLLSIYFVLETVGQEEWGPALEELLFSSQPVQRAENVVVVQGVALVLGWFGLLYYSRGFQFTGIYTVVLQKVSRESQRAASGASPALQAERATGTQDGFHRRFTLASDWRLGSDSNFCQAPPAPISQGIGQRKAEITCQSMILQDVVRFLLVYVVFLLGFASALSALTIQCVEPGYCPYRSVRSALGALFKLTLGLGNLSGPEHSKFPVFFLLLLITYVILTSVLLLNMLIALMTETVNVASSRTEKIWRVQRAITILDLERCLPKTWRWWLQEGKIHFNLNVGLTPNQERDLRMCLRVNERKRQTRAPGRNQVMGINEDPTVSPAATLRDSPGNGQATHTAWFQAVLAPQ